MGSPKTKGCDAKVGQAKRSKKVNMKEPVGMSRAEKILIYLIVTIAMGVSGISVAPKLGAADQDVVTAKDAKAHEKWAEAEFKHARSEAADRDKRLSEQIEEVARLIRDHVKDDMHPGAAAKFAEIAANQRHILGALVDLKASVGDD